MSLTSATQQVDISLIKIYELSPLNGPILAQTLVPGNTYAFHFSMKTPSAQAEWEAMMRVNGDSPITQASTDVGGILGGQSALGGMSFYTTFNPKNAFTPANPVDSNTLAKVALNSLGDVSGAGSFEMIVNVKINPASLPNVDKLDIRFQSKSATQQSPLYFESYTIGAPLPSQGDFSFAFFLVEQGSASKFQVSSSKPAIIEANKNYALEYVITNASGTNYPTATLVWSTNTPSTFTVSPTQISLPGLNNNSSVGGSVSLKSTQTCSSSVPQCSTLTASLSNVGTGNSPTTYFISFFTSPEKSILLNVSPGYLIPGQSQLVQVVTLDQLNNLIGNEDGLSVQGQLVDVGGQAVEKPILFTESSSGLFFASIPSASEGESLEIVASASGYVSGMKILPVSNQIALNYSQDFSCVSFSPVPLSFTLGAAGVLNVRTQGCPEAVSLYTTGFSQNGTVIQLSVKRGNSTMNASAPVLLNASDFKSLSVISPTIFGQYPLYVYAKFASQSSYSLVKNVDVIVNPLGGSAQCLNLSKYVFDVKGGSDKATVVNNCNPLVSDAFYPSVNLGVNGVYAHAVPSILTPEMRSPVAAVSFTYTLNVDYNNSQNTDVNHEDVQMPPSIGDGNWFRYEIENPSQFFTNKADYGATTPILISDAQFFTPKGASNPDHVLESTGRTQTPWAVVGKKSVLFESTFITYNEATLDDICFRTSQVDDVVVKIDEVVVQSAPSNGCAINDYYFSPGPHHVQVFMYEDDAEDYWIVARYRDASITGSSYAPLSDGKGKGFLLSPQVGVPFSNGAQTNGSFFIQGMNALVPSASHTIPSSIGFITGNAQQILFNEGEIDHLKQTYVNVSTNNPSIRAFVHGNEIRGQFVGFDDPTQTPEIIVENLGVSGEQYGVVTLND